MPSVRDRPSGNINAALIRKRRRRPWPQESRRRRQRRSRLKRLHQSVPRCASERDDGNLRRERAHGEQAGRARHLAPGRVGVGTNKSPGGGAGARDCDGCRIPSAGTAICRSPSSRSAASTGRPPRVPRARRRNRAQSAGCGTSWCATSRHVGRRRSRWPACAPT